MDEMGDAGQALLAVGGTPGKEGVGGFKFGVHGWEGGWVYLNSKRAWGVGLT